MVSMSNIKFFFYFTGVSFIPNELVEFNDDKWEVISRSAASRMLSRQAELQILERQYLFINCKKLSVTRILGALFCYFHF